MLRQNIKFWALLAEECSWAVGQALPVTVRAAGVKAVSPAERGRSVATRLDAGEHAVMLIGPTARVIDARVLAATGAPPPPRSSRFHGQAVAHRPTPFASIGETTGRARSAAGAGGRPRGPTGRARSARLTRADAPSAPGRRNSPHPIAAPAQARQLRPWPSDVDRARTQLLSRGWTRSTPSRGDRRHDRDRARGHPGAGRGRQAEDGGRPRVPRAGPDRAHPGDKRPKSRSRAVHLGYAWSSHARHTANGHASVLRLGGR